MKVKYLDFFKQKWFNRLQIVQFECPQKSPSQSQVVRIPFSHFQSASLRGNKNWPPQYEGEIIGKFSEQKWLNRLKMVQFESLRHRNPRLTLRL